MTNWEKEVIFHGHRGTFSHRNYIKVTAKKMGVFFDLGPGAALTTFVPWSSIEYIHGPKEQLDAMSDALNFGRPYVFGEND